MNNKKVFLDLRLEHKQKGKQPGKTFNNLGWENIYMEFKVKTVLQYQFLQFKNLYS